MFQKVRMSFLPKATSKNEFLYEISYTVINFHMHKNWVLICVHLEHIVQSNSLTEWAYISNFLVL